MLSGMRNLIKLFRPIFIPTDDDIAHDTYKSSLNYEAGRIYYVAFFSIFLWPTYIPFYLWMHPYPVFSTIVISGFGLTCAALVVIRLNLIKAIKVQYSKPFQFAMSYVVIAMALLTGLAGDSSIVFMASFTFALLMPVYTPFSLPYKLSLMVFSYAVFLAALFATGFDFSAVANLFSVLWQLGVLGCSVVFSLSLNNLRSRAWKQQQKLAEMMNEVEAQARFEVEMLAAQHASKSKSDFLARMSHEIRTPMNAIMGMTELALREELPKPAKEFMFTIIQASQYLLSIINDILDISKIETGRTNAAIEEYSLSSVIYDTVNIARTKVYDSRLRFIVNVDSRMPNVLYGDAAKIRQIMLNLLSNAVKFTEKGFVSLSISGQMTAEDSMTLTIEVADSGTGIKRADIDKLFKEFSQLAGQSSAGLEGTGLGLAITRSFVDAMGGEIEISSEYGKGTTFTVTIPQRVLQKQALAEITNRDSHNVLVFERREAGRDSITKSMDNLEVKYNLVSSYDDFYSNVMTGDYTHIFIAPILYAGIKERYPDIQAEASIALMTEFGETITYEDMSTITAPIFCIPVANFLNGESENNINNFDRRNKAIFKAPTARVLVVDDLKTNLVVTAGLLQSYGLQTDLCRSGANAIDAVKSNRYDLVLMDHMMPVMDGVEATAHIRALGSGGDEYYRNLPIVAMTANAVSGMREMFLENGFSDFFSKPIDTITLDAILEKWIPAEKKESVAESNGHSEKDNEAKALLGGIKGLDVSKGITLTGGTYEKYLTMLEVFHDDGLAKINDIKSSLEAEDLRLFTTYVHAIKNACSISGADALSNAARELEKAGIENNSDFIRENTSAFLSDFKTMLTSINKALEAENLDALKEIVEADVIKRHIEDYRAALIALDTRKIREVTGILQSIKHNAETDRTVKAILDKKLIGDYNEAISLASNLLEKLS